MVGNKFYWLLLCNLLQVYVSTGQSTLPEDSYIIELFETTVEQNDQAVEFNQFRDQLMDLYRNPVNINKADFTEMINTIIISPKLALEIINYRKKYGPFVDKRELLLLSAVSKREASLILPFITIEVAINQPKTKASNHRVILRNRQILNEQKGFTTQNDDAPSYEGSKDQVYFQYRARLSNQISGALAFEKDAGENFLINRKPAHLVGTIEWRPSKYGFEKIIVGNYNLQIGQGLTYWNGLAFGKTAFSTNIIRSGPSVTSYASANEFEYFRGLAIQYKLSGKTELLLFTSSRSKDASLKKDSSLHYFSSLQPSGYQRTKSEINNSETVNENIGGLRIASSIGDLRLGVNASYNQYSLPYIKDDSWQNKNSFNDSKNVLTSIDYILPVKNLLFYGESSRSINDKYAFLNGIKANISDDFDLVTVYRNYQPGYFAPYAKAFSEKTSTGNEMGWYTGINWNAATGWSINYYFDLFRFPWLTFQADKPSSGYEHFIQATHYFDTDNMFYIRYKYEKKEQNIDSPEKPEHLLGDRVRNNFRIHLAQQVTESLSQRLRVEYVTSSIGKDIKEGFLAYYDIRLNRILRKINLSTRFTFFDTEGFEAAIYAFEHDVQWSFSVPAYFNTGIDYYVMIKLSISKSIDFWLRYSRTYYSDQATIGSGNDQIEGNTRNEIKAQLLCEF